MPIIVERAMWWPGPETSSDFWYEAHNSPGTTGTAARWALGGAELGGSDDAQTYVLIANTSETSSLVRVWMVDDSGPRYEHMVTVPAKSRMTIPLNTAFPSSPFTPISGRFGVIVEPVVPGVGAVPVVVERATYASPGGVFWSRGGNAAAAPLP